MNRLPIIIVVILGILAIAVAGLAIRMRMTGKSVITVISEPFVKSPEAIFHKDRILVLLLGLDYDYDTKDQESSKNARTDSIVAAALDFPTKTFRVVSVPRDMDYVNKKGQEDKINAAYAEAGGNYFGSDRAIGKFLGLPSVGNSHYFDKHIALRINATKEFIDAIGGIDVPVTETLNYDDTWGHLHIHIKPGMQHFNGEKAVGYMRFRHDACSDPCRIKRQQQVIRLVVTKLKENKFNDITHIGDLIDVVKRNVITDLSTEEMTSLAVAFSGASLADVKMTQIPYVSDKDTPNGNLLVPDEKARTQIVAANLVGAFAVSAPTPKPDLTGLTPRLVKVDIRNGSGTAGLGAKMAADLKKRGFVVASVGNADSYDHDHTEIHTHSKLTGAGELLRLSLKLPTAEVVSDVPSPLATASAVATATAAALASATSDVTVIVGRDYEAKTVSTAALVP